MKDFQYQPARDLGLDPTARWKSVRRESGLLESLGQWLWWAFIRVYLRLYHRLEIHGAFPRELPFVLVANHGSHLDAMVLGAPLPPRQRSRVFPLAAGDTFFDSPLVATFAAFALNALPVWRKRFDPADFATLRERLTQEPCAYLLFPEGTRSRDGQMAPFKRGIGMLVAGTEVPVIPCYLEGAHRAFPPGAKFPRPRKVRLWVGPPHRFGAAKNEREGWEAVAGELEAAVRGLSPSLPTSLAPPR